jgi:hypothetical protein
MASRRAVRQQPHRSRPRPPQTLPPTNARPTQRPDRDRHHRWARVHAEPAPWPLRARGRNSQNCPGRRRVYRTRASDLILSWIHDLIASIDQLTQQRRSGTLLAQLDGVAADCRKQLGDQRALTGRAWLPPGDGGAAQVQQDAVDFDMGFVGDPSVPRRKASNWRRAAVAYGADR